MEYLANAIRKEKAISTIKNIKEETKLRLFEEIVVNLKI